MRKFLAILMAVAMLSVLAVSASALWEPEEAFCEVKFNIGKQSVAWAADGTVTPGEYYEVAIDPTWLSYAVGTDDNMEIAKGLNPQLFMSWDETYVYMATVYKPAEVWNEWDADPATMWVSGAIQVNYANFDEVSSEYRLEYGVGRSTATGNMLYNVWADGCMSGYVPTEEDAVSFENDGVLTIETRCPWDAFADEDNTGKKIGNGFNFCLVWTQGTGTDTSLDYIHTQLAEGCTGNGKHAEYFAQVTLDDVYEVAAPEPLEGNASLIWDFGGDEAMSAKMGANSVANVTYVGEEDYYIFTATGADPYVSVDTPVDSVDLVKWAKVRVKNPSQATAIELFGATDGRSLTGSECTHFEIVPNADEWATYIIYIPDENVKTVNAYKDPQYAITEPYWAGAVNWIRLDPMWHEGDDGNDAGGSCDVGDEIYIDYIAFFANEEDAKAFRADQDNTVEPAPAFGVQDASGSFDGEAAANLFDGDENTKWCFDSTTYTEPYVIWNLENAMNVTGYEIVTANDNKEYAGRNPGAWTLSGSADGQNWTVIADVAADTVLQDENFTPYTFAADAAGEYSWFKFEIKNVVGGGVCQISGLNLLTGDVTPSGAAAAEEAPAATEEAPAATEEAPAAAEEAPAPAEEAPQTFDFGVIALVSAVVSLAGYAVAKKH